MKQLIGIGGAGPNISLHAINNGVRISSVVQRSDGHLETLVAPVAAGSSIVILPQTSGISKRLVSLKVIPNNGAAAIVDLRSATNVEGEFARQSIGAGQQLTFSDAEGWRLTSCHQCVE